MKHKFRGCLLTLPMLALAYAAAVHAQATTFKERFTEPFSLDDVNPCTGEPVTLSGELLITIKTTIDGNGGFHGTFHLVPRHVIGEDANGVTHRAVGGTRDHTNETIGAANFTVTDTFNMIGQGGVDDFSAFIRIHVTVNANGVVTVETVLERAECHG